VRSGRTSVSSPRLERRDRDDQWPGDLALNQRDLALVAAIWTAGYRRRGGARGLLSLAVEDSLETLERAVLDGFHRPFGAPEHPGYLAVTHIGEEAQRENLLLVGRQLAEGLLQRHPLGDHTCAILALLIDQVIAGIERSGDDAATALIAVEDVGGDRVEPAEEGLLVAVLEALDAVDDFDEDLLG